MQKSWSCRGRSLPLQMMLSVSALLITYVSTRTYYFEARLYGSPSLGTVDDMWNRSTRPLGRRRAASEVRAIQKYTMSTNNPTLATFVLSMICSSRELVLELQGTTPDVYI